MTDPLATEIRLRRVARLLEVSFADGSRFEHLKEAEITTRLTCGRNLGRPIHVDTNPEY